MTKEEHNKIIDFVNSDDYMLLNSYISKPYEETIIEQDKEIEKLKEEVKSANESITWWSNRYKAIEHLYRYTPEKGFELVGDDND